MDWLIFTGHNLHVVIAVYTGSLLSEQMYESEEMFLQVALTRSKDDEIFVVSQFFLDQFNQCQNGNKVGLMP